MCLKHFPPKEINSLYGYRSKLSMHNEQNWKKAQKLLNELLWRGGVLFLGISIIGIYADFHPILSMILGFVSIISLWGYLTWYIEKNLKKNVPQH